MSIEETSNAVVVCTGLNPSSEVLNSILSELEVDSSSVLHFNALTTEEGEYVIPGLMNVSEKVIESDRLVIITAVHQMGLPAPLSALLGTLGQFGLTDKVVSYVCIPGSLRHSMVPQVNLVPTIMAMGGEVAKHNFVTTANEFTRGFSEFELQLLQEMKNSINRV